MRRHTARFILWLGLLSAPARADIVEVSLPGLTGAYPFDGGNTARTVTLQLPQHPDLIRGASLRVIGSTVVGLADCGQAGEIDLWPMEFLAEMQDGTGDWWQSLSEPSFVHGLFMSTAAFEPLAGTATWDFLLDGEAEITLFGTPASAQSVCDPLVVPHGSIAEAVFIIDADFPLSVHATTWGRIKALYR